jgi:hypothetical protein
MYEAALPHHLAALQANGRDPTYRLFFRNNCLGLAQTLLALGEHRAAAAAATRFLGAAVYPANDAYNAACFLALCVPLAQHDKHLPEPQRKELIQAYGDQAIAALRQAVHNGFNDVAHMKKDTDLDALRGRGDFKKLLGELGTNTKPTGR